MNEDRLRAGGQGGRTGLRDPDYARALSKATVFLRAEGRISNSKLRHLTGLNYDQAIKFFSRAIAAGSLERHGRAAGTFYMLRDR
jgi:hypothetical protein